MSSIDAAMRELRAGVAHWYTRPLWPRDFHNLDYRRWFEENPRGEFSLEWWKPFRRTLHDWIAIRPLSYAAVTENLVSVLPDLSAAWKEACEPVFDREISEVKWEKIEAFPKLVTAIKPTKYPTPVFTSKFCHFLLPRVFPVVDNEAMGGRWQRYEDYFRFVQDQWEATSPEDRDQMRRYLAGVIELTGSEVFDGFPMTNKLVELRIIGRRHRADASVS